MGLSRTREQFDQVILEELSEKKRRIEEKSAIFYRDNARAMCCKIDTPEIGKGEMGSFLPPLLFRYCSLKLLYPSSNSPEITK